MPGATRSSQHGTFRDTRTFGESKTGGASLTLLIGPSCVTITDMLNKCAVMHKYVLIQCLSDVSEPFFSRKVRVKTGGW